MRTAELLIYTLCLTGNVVSSSGQLESMLLRRLSADPNASNSQEMKTMFGILNKILARPLRGSKVTLILEDDLRKSSVTTSDLIKFLEWPVSLLLLPRVMPASLRYHFNVTGEPGDIDSSQDNSDVFYSPVKDSVFLIVLTSDDRSWWPLWYPLKHWLNRATIVVSPSPGCLKMNYLQTPLLEKSSSLALICAYEIKGDKPSKTPYKVWTWKPFASGKQLQDLGLWNPEYFISWDDLFVDRFDDMTRKNMSILAMHEDRPLIYNTPEGDLRGLNYLIIDGLKYWLKFSLEYDTRDMIQWELIRNSIKRGENDVFINYATITPERSAEFDLTVPYHREGFAIIIENPPPLPQWQNVLYPFSWDVWFAVILTLVLTSITYHLLYYESERSLVTNTIYILQSLLSNPMESLPQGWLIRNFLLVWMFVSWFVNMSYTCNLIAVLTVPVFPAKIDTKQELAESNYRLCMVDYGEFVDEALAEATDPTLSALNDILDMVPSSDVLEYIGEEYCIEKVLAGTHAHTETASYIIILYNILGHGSQVYNCKEDLYPGYLAFMLQKYVPWKYKFDVGIQLMIETGLTRKWYQDSMDYFSAYFRKAERPELHALSLGHLQGPFLLFVFGLFLSLFTLFGEVLFPEKKMSRVIPTGDM